MLSFVKEPYQSYCKFFQGAKLNILSLNREKNFAKRYGTRLNFAQDYFKDCYRELACCNKQVFLLIATKSVGNAVGRNAFCYISTYRHSKHRLPTARRKEVEQSCAKVVSSRRHFVVTYFGNPVGNDTALPLRVYQPYCLHLVAIVFQSCFVAVKISKSYDACNIRCLIETMLWQHDVFAAVFCGDYMDFS